MAERRGFEVLHGIVDSLWVKKRRATEEDFQDLSKEIEDEIGLPMSFEGIYKWIAFLPSRMHEDVPVLNRYFGVFEDGEMKVRGIEMRRSDTVKLVADCQREILQLLAAAQDVEGVKKLVPDALETFAAYTHSIWSGDVPVSDLVIVNSLSKNWNQYRGNLAHISAVNQLADEGLELLAGQSVSYVVTNYRSRIQEERVRPVQLLDESVTYDRRRYTELLARGVVSILEPFGVNENALYESIGMRRRGERQS
jgi:DNA polymerase elongation subunit (family B)